ncbi:c-type cytochrome [Methylocaldum sp. MU1018]
MRLVRILQASACAAALAISIPQAAFGDDLKRPDAANIALACGGCHGASGQGMGSIPAIAGIPESEFVRAMQEFQSGSRSATVMDRIARGYRYQDFVALARFFENRREKP